MIINVEYYPIKERTFDKTQWQRNKVKALSEIKKGINDTYGYLRDNPDQRDKYEAFEDENRLPKSSFKEILESYQEYKDTETF